MRRSRGAVPWVNSISLILLVFILSTQPAVSEYAISLDGISSYATASAPPELGNGALFSLSFWVKAATLDSGLQAVVSLASSDLKQAMTVGWSGGYFFYYDRYLGGTKLTNGSYSRKRWHHVALTTETVDRGSYVDAAGNIPAHRAVTLYVDGKAALEVVTIFPDLEDAELTIGMEHHNGDKHRYFTGLVDEVRIYKGPVEPETVIGNAFMKLRREDSAMLYSYYDFNDISANKEDSVQKTANIARDGFKASLSYAGRHFVERTPYDPVQLTNVVDNDEKPFSDALYTVPRSRLGGANVTVRGSGFCDSHFLSVGIQDGDVIVEGEVLEYIDSKRIVARLPAYNKTGSVALRVTNGGFNAMTTPWLLEYVPAMELADGIVAFYPLSGDVTNAVNRTNLTYAGSVVQGLTFGNDRNGVEKRALYFAGESGPVEIPAPLRGLEEWSFCTWIKAKRGNWVLYSEQEMHRNRVLHRVNVIEILDDGIAGYGTLSLDGVRGGRIAWNAWQSICVLRKEGVVQFYTSGVLTGNATAEPVLHPHSTVGYVGENFTGSIDEFGFWLRAINNYDALEMFRKDSAAVEFDGSLDSFISIANTPLEFAFNSTLWRPGGIFSVEAWIRPANVIGRKTILAHGDSITLTLETSILACSVKINSVTSRSISTPLATIRPREWQLVVATYDGSSLRLAVNGVVVAQITFPTSVFPVSSWSPVTVASEFAGGIGELRLWSSSLTNVSIANHYKCPPAVSTAGLYAYFHMEDGVGSLYYHGSNPLLRLNITTPAEMRPFWSFVSYLADISTTLYPLSTAEGDGLVLASAGGPSYFTVQTRGKCSRLQKQGGSPLQGVVVGPTEIHNYQTVLAEVWDNNDGTYTGLYTNITRCGHYALRIESSAVPIFNTDLTGVYLPQTVYGSPFHFYMEPGATNATLSYIFDAEGSSYLQSGYISAREGAPTDLLLQTVDSYGCPRTSGGDIFNVTLSGAYNGTGYFEDFGDGTYLIEYFPHTVGPARLEVTLNGTQVGRSGPFDVRVDCTTSFGVNNTGSPFCAQAQPGGSIRFGKNATGLSEIVVGDCDHLNLDIPGFTLQAWVMPEASPELPQARQIVVAKESPRLGHGYWLGLQSPPLTTNETGELISPETVSAVTPRRAAAGLYVGSETYRTVVSNVLIPLDFWTHIAVTYDGKKMEMYVNGSVAGVATWQHEAIFRANAQPIVIGRGYTGCIDELQVVGEVRSPERIAATMTCPAERESVLAWWRFNEGSGIIAYDYSIMGADGNLTNNASVNMDRAWTQLPAPSNAGILSQSLTQLGSEAYPFVNLKMGSSIEFNVTFYDQCGFLYAIDDPSAVNATYTQYYQEFTTSSHTGIEHPLDMTLKDIDGDLALGQDQDLCVRSGVFIGSFTPESSCGLGKLLISLNDEVIKVANVTVLSENKASANASVVVLPFGSLNAGQPSSLWIFPNDKYGCSVTSGNDSFVVLLTRTSMGSGDPMWEPDTAALHAEVHWDPELGGKYEARFTPPAPGKYMLTVGLETETGYEHVKFWSTPYMKETDAIRASMTVMVDPAPWRTVVAGDSNWGSPTPSPRYEPTVAVYNGQMFMFRGWGNDKMPMSDVWQYPLDTDRERGSYLYKQTLTIDNLAEPIEIRFTVDTFSLLKQGKIRGDCADFQFVDAATGTILPYFFDPAPGCGATTTGFWIMAPSAPSSTILMFYGNSAEKPFQHADGSKILTSFDSFEDGKSPLQSGWQLVDTCSLPQGDAAAFLPVANFTDANPGGSWVLKVDTATLRGGSIAKTLAGNLSLASYVLRAIFYDSDADESSHWISPDFDDCGRAPGAGGKHFPTGSGLGVYTCATSQSYSMMYPWKSTGVNRTAGVRAFELLSNGTDTIYKVDDIVVGTKKGPGPLSRIFLRGGGPKPGPESSGYWDNIYAARYDPRAVITAGPEEPVVWENKKWKKVRAHGAMPPVRDADGAVQFNGQLYLVGGFASDQIDNKTSIWTFDFEARRWAQAKPWGSLRPPAREDHSVVLYEDKVAIFGGRCERTVFSDLWLYDLSDEAWLPPLESSVVPSPRFGHSAVVYKGAMYVFGGFVPWEGAATADIWVFSFGTSSWSNITTKSGPSPRYGHRASLREGSMYVSGGAYEDDEAFPELWRFDFDYLRWQQLPSAPGLSNSGLRDSHSATLRGQDMFLFGGHAPYGHSNSEFLSTSVY